MMFAGGGTNSAPESFSAYTVSKIALIKMVELLDAENPDFRFTILGPGWVRSKIHQETLNSPHTPKKTRDETMRRLECDDFIPLNKVVETIKWLLAAPKSVIGGRNFSAAHDPFQNEYFANRLLDDPDILKLRRFGNDYSWMSDAD
jgi:NAD(P)-dependent dehydrogenase (short-subunit alcohol dehydrogenase family)